MDILKELANNRKYTLHSHTQFCDGRAPMQDFVEEAIREGFTHYGFSPHSPVPLESPCNMSKDDVPSYLAEVDRLRDAYGDRIKLYAAMEIDYLGPHWGPSNEYFVSLPLDYRIGSVHFIPSQDGEFIDIDGSADRFKVNMAAKFHDDIRYVVETFFNSSAAMIEAGGFDIIGHFDKVAHNASAYLPGIEDQHWFTSLADSLVDLICERKPIVEINTKAKAIHGRIFPSERYLPKLVEAGVPIVVNSDAHVPALINASRDYGFELIDKFSNQISHVSRYDAATKA